MTQEGTVRLSVYGALASAVALLVAAPGPLTSLRTLRDAGSAEVATDPLVALVALLAWTCAAYLLAVTAVTAGGHLPGTAGAALRSVARRVAPGTLRRALEVALGLTLAVGTLGAGTASAAGPLPDRGLVAQTGTGVELPLPEVAPAPSLDHPVSGAPSPSLDHPVAATPTPSLDHPVADPAPAAAPAAAPTAAPTADLDWPQAASPTSTARATPAGEEVVVVRPGDSLWEIAEERLEQQTGERPSDAQVAQAWPSWWQANREVVGDDPDLLHPGTPLAPPTDP